MKILNSSLLTLEMIIPLQEENQQEIVLNPRIIKKEPNLKARGALAALNVRTL